jgi:chorismate dehydratase
VIIPFYLSDLNVGDRVFEAVKRYPFCYDLSEIWKDYTGFDFVFACWIANKPIDIEFISAFNRALAFGLLHIQEVIEDCEKSYPDYQLNEYFYKNLSFTFDDSKRKGLELFLKLNNQIDNKIS